MEFIMKFWKCFTFCCRKSSPTTIPEHKVNPSGAACTSEDELIQTLRNAIAKSLDRQCFVAPRSVVDEVVVEKAKIPMYYEAGNQLIDSGHSVEVVFTEH
jgi:hypothetical protein